MHGIFINYRREDVAGFARSLFDRLRAHFGDNQVFMDVSNIEPGLDFIDTIDKSLKSCEALLVLIGPDWESVCVERSGEPDDFVRIEVAAALKRNVRVIPVLVQGATMPDEANLPEDIKPLVRRQATALSNDRFDSDIERLIEVLEKTLGSKFKPKPLDQASSSKKTWLSGRSGILVGFLLAFVLLVFIGVWVDEDEFDPVLQDEVDTFLDVAEGTDIDVNIDELWSIEEKAQVQLLLQNLGYQPGTVDGVIGANTTTAIQRFQRDVGLAANGLINEDLLDALIVAEPLIQAIPTANQRLPTELNLTGTWYDNFGNRVVMQQRGSEVNAVSYNSYSGLQMSVSRGTVYGNQLNYQWDAGGSTGMGVGTMQPDLRHMDIVVTDNDTGLVEANQLHKGHLPGQ